MNIVEHQEFTQLDTVRFCDEGVYELDGNQTMVFVPRNEIRDLQLVFATSAERQITVFIISIILLVISATPIVALINVFIFGGSFKIIFSLLLALSVPALFMLKSLKKRYVLLVTKRTGKRKLVFQRCSDSNVIEAFILRSKRRHGFA